MKLPRLTLILGGARSGKSRHGENLIRQLPEPWTYIATAQAFDDEMSRRIEEHRARRGAGWITIEAPSELGDAVRRAGETAPLLVDCLTLWLSNIMLAEASMESEMEALEAALDLRSAPTVLVSSEVGMGIVPENALARAFRDEAGQIHQRLAERADCVLTMVAGLPLTIKPAK